MSDIGGRSALRARQRNSGYHRPSRYDGETTAIPSVKTSFLDSAAGSLTILGGIAATGVTAYATTGSTLATVVATVGAFKAAQCMFGR